jgi:retinol-binding protein 3
MFERLIALLFRLYPLEFRRTYGRDAWQLIRDRAGAERGPLRRARLLLDLLRDIAAISLRGWHARPALVSAPELRDGTPRFHIIESHGPRPQSIAAGMMTSFVMWASFSLLFQPTQIADGPARLGVGNGADASFDPGGDEDEDEQQVTIDISAARRQIIEAVAASLKERYFDPAIGHKLGNALITYAKNGAYENVGLGEDLAHRLTTHIYQAGRTFGVPMGVAIADVIYLGAARRNAPPPGLFANCRLHTETLRRNIGYVKLDVFAPPHVCHDPIARAMTALNDADALIIDLRDNGGGMGETALQIASYLFDRPAVMFDPRPNSPVPTHTEPVAASRLTDKPVYLLTSSTTQSAAEYFVYNLAMHKRVTIVGERTGGAQHSGAFRKISEDFGIAIQETPPPPSPFPVKGWEIIGVDPDVRIESGLALRTATRLATSR